VSGVGVSLKRSSCQCPLGTKWWHGQTCLSVDGESTDKLPLSVAPLGRETPMLGRDGVFKKIKMEWIEDTVKNRYT
jgi:hypothetical protein